jgi:transposase
MAPKPDLAEIQKVKDLAAQGLSSREITERVKFGRTKVYLILNPDKQKAQNEHNNKTYRPKQKKRFAKNQLFYHNVNPDYQSYRSVRAEVMREHSRTWSELDKLAYKDLLKMRAELEKLEGVPYHVDHVISLWSGGRHHPSNMQLLTAEDNVKKGTDCGIF